MIPSQRSAAVIVMITMMISDEPMEKKKYILSSGLTSDLVVMPAYDLDS